MQGKGADTGVGQGVLRVSEPHHKEELSWRLPYLEACLNPTLGLLKDQQVSSAHRTRHPPLSLSPAHTPHTPFASFEIFDVSGRLALINRAMLLMAGEEVRWHRNGGATAGQIRGQRVQTSKHGLADSRRNLSCSL